MQFTDICLITDDVLKLRDFYEAVFAVKAEGDANHSTLVLGILTILCCSEIRTAIY